MEQELANKKRKRYAGGNFLIKWIERLSVRSKFSIIIGLIILILLFGLGSFAFGMKVMSSIRSYVGGEGLWSKAQKEASNNLIKYSNSFDKSDYDNFLKFLQVPLGDKQARLELEKQNPDLNIARSGFIQGGNSPDDVSDLVFLYRKFRHVKYMDDAIKIWTGGDAGIAELIRVGDKIHATISKYNDPDNPAEKTLLLAELSPLIQETYTIDQQLTVLENNFSATLGNGSRSIKNILLWAIAILSLVLGAFALWIAFFIEEMIIQVDKEKSEFISLASHQLRTPPTSIKWFMEMLLSGEVGPLNDKQREYFAEVNKNNERMITLINMLLNTSKFELGVFTIVPELTNIPNLVHAVSEEYKLQREAKKIILKEKYPDDLPLVSVDPKLLHIVLQNIILNAIKYTPVDGTIEIEVLVKNKREKIGGETMAADSLIIKVGDTGYGIPKSESEQIFSKLFRGSNIRKKDTDGTGLGLYLSKSIMDNLKGNLWFESYINVGTTFYIAIPIVKEARI